MLLNARMPYFLAIHCFTRYPLVIKDDENL